MSIRESNGRRQPARAVRNSTTRPANYYARPVGFRSSSGMPPENAPTEAPGFFPAVTYFTDGLSALPKETMRHLTLLKETEGKAYQPDQSVGDLLNSLDALPPAPRQYIESPSGAFFSLSMNNSISGSANASVVDGGVPKSSVAIPDNMPPIDSHREQRAAIYRDLQLKLREMTMVLDEKSMVLATANETVAQQLQRLDSTMPHIETEISEDARFGSNTHWALPHMKDARRAAGSAPERIRREAHAVTNLANAAVAVENDGVASRSEARREAVAAKRSRQHHADSDFDVEKSNAKKAHAAKARKPQEERVDYRATQSANKRRRTDKPGAVAMERTVSTATNGKGANQRDTHRETAPSDAARKKKPAPAQPSSKKRAGAKSPSIASSPTRAGFGASNRDASPGAASLRKLSQPGDGGVDMAFMDYYDRMRGNPVAAARSSRNGNGAHAENVEAKGSNAGNPRKPANGTGPSAHSDSSAMANGSNDKVHELPAAPTALQREENELAGEGAALAQASQVRSRGGSRPSKPGTPVTSTSANEPAAGVAMARSRSTRGANQHSNAATTSAVSSPRVQPIASPRKTAKKLSAHRSPSVSSLSSRGQVGLDFVAEPQWSNPEDDDDEDEPTYCKCGGVSYGNMVACDNDNCPREWFHLECVGLRKVPSSREKWYCSKECEDEARRESAH